MVQRPARAHACPGEHGWESLALWWKCASLDLDGVRLFLILFLTFFDDFLRDCASEPWTRSMLLERLVVREPGIEAVHLFRGAVLQGAYGRGGIVEEVLLLRRVPAEPGSRLRLRDRHLATPRPRQLASAHVRMPGARLQLICEDNVLRLHRYLRQGWLEDL